MTDFEDFERTTSNEYDYDDFETVEWPDDDSEEMTVMGEILSIDHNVGKYDSTVYLLHSPDDGKLLVWGNGAINTAVEKIENLGYGDWLAIRHTGETYENKYGEFPSFDVRFKRSDR